MKIRRLFFKLVPRSLLSRMLWLLLLAIVLAQSLISGLWMQQLQKH
jgi:K+ transporter